MAGAVALPSLALIVGGQRSTQGFGWERTLKLILFQWEGHLRLLQALSTPVLPVGLAHEHRVCSPQMGPSTFPDGERQQANL